MPDAASCGFDVVTARVDFDIDEVAAEEKEEKQKEKDKVDKDDEGDEVRGKEEKKIFPAWLKERSILSATALDCTTGKHLSTTFLRRRAAST